LRLFSSVLVVFFLFVLPLLFSVFDCHAWSIPV
jgi:hypothetical protein